ncbi:MAG: GNAT family N-acetyltransferase [Acidimicrobiia bacterium]
MLTVREATPDDYDDIARLTVASFRALPRWVGDEYGKHLADVAVRVGSGGVVLVAEQGEALIGSVTLVLDEGPLFDFDYGTDGDCSFRMLATDPAAWGSGAGPALVGECIRRARAAGRKQMAIASTEWMTTAHRIYERFGFRRRPDLDPTWDDICGVAFVLEL